MTNKLVALRKKIAAATGSDWALDAEIARVLDDAPPGDGTTGDGPTGDNPAANPATGYTASVDSCIALIIRAAPDWHWHVGHGPSGVLPYAALTKDGKGDDATRVETFSATVPLALLGALVEAKLSDRAEKPTAE